MMQVVKINVLLFKAAVIFTFIFYRCASGQEVSDKEFEQKYDEVISRVACEAMAQTDGAQMKVNLSRYSTHEELAKLTFWNYGNDLSNTKLVFPDDISWKRKLVDSIFEIFKVSCQDKFVPHGYINLFRELAMIYLNSAEPRTTNNTEAWNQMQRILEMCQEDRTPYDLELRGMNVIGIKGQKDGTPETAELYPPEERADTVFSGVDMVVDNLWWMFSHAMGKCYSKIERPAIVAPRLRSMFIRDILRPLLNRWGDPGPLQNFAPIVGNYNIRRAQRNMRFCVTAAYFSNGIAELQMVRPLKVGFETEGITAVMNAKTGATFG